MGLAVDSNILIRYFARDNDQLLEKAVNILHRARPSSLLLDRITIAEVGYVLRSVYGFKKAQIVLAYRSTLANGVFTLEDREITESAVDLFESERPLSFEDCWLLALKRAGKVSDVHTFDEALQKRLRKAV